MQRAHTWCVRAVHNLENCMKESPRSADGEGRSRLSRRTLFAGATTVGALAAAATVLPRVRPTMAPRACASCARRLVLSVGGST